jgi:hypothetical protein
MAMFALAAQYSDPEDLRRLNQDTVVDENTFLEAQALLSKPSCFFGFLSAAHALLSMIDKPFGASRLSTCQALLLLGYRAIGLSMISLASVTQPLNQHYTGGLTDASLFLSKAIILNVF